MMKAAKDAVSNAIQDGLLIDGLVTHTSDDIALLMSHTHGSDAPEVHKFAWNTFIKATEFANACCCYGAGQDLLADAPLSNFRGAGPGVAEIIFEFNRKEPRPA